MDQELKKYLASFEFGKLQRHENMGVFPIMTSLNHSPKYLTLKEALAEQMFVVTEIGQEGSVPELKVVNEGNDSVLLLDGEELAGAKQNRVLNTTILIIKKSEVVIPVSCTEQGRWSYLTDKFYDAGTVMPSFARIKKAKSVASSLRTSREFRSDQGEVWADVNYFALRADVSSETGAMRDVYQAREKDLGEYIKAFAYVEGQKGIMVFINGQIVGFDFISYAPAFEHIHGKLVKSYAMEASLEKVEGTKKPDAGSAKDFLKEVGRADEKKYESVGKGWDHRYEGAKIVGSALIYQKKVIHAAFFRNQESDDLDRISSVKRRRGYRKMD